MEKYLIPLFSIVLILMFFVIPLKVKFKVHFNVSKNLGFYCFKLAFFTVLCGKLKITEQGELEISNSANRIPKQTESGNRFFKKLFPKLELSWLEIYAVCGRKDNAFQTAMLSGLVLTIIETVKSVCKAKQPDLQVLTDVSTTSKSDEMILTSAIIIKVSLLSCLIALFQSWMMPHKEKINE